MGNDIEEKREKFKKFFRIDWIIKSIEGRIKKMKDFHPDDPEGAMFKKLEEGDVRISYLFELLRFEVYRTQSSDDQPKDLFRRGKFLRDARQEDCPYGFDDSILLYIDWSTAVKAMRAQIDQSPETEKAILTSFAHYEWRWIERFVEEKIT